MAHDRLAISAALLFGQGGDVVDADGAAAHHDGGGGDRGFIPVADVGRELIPHELRFEDLAEPGERHVEADRPDGAEGVAGGRIAHPADGQEGQRLHRRRDAFGHHAGQVDRVAQAAALENLPRSAPRAGIHPVFAHPIRPLQAAHIEVRWRTAKCAGRDRLRCAPERKGTPS